MKLLTGAGFDHEIALRLAAVTDVDAIRQQINWLEKRGPRENPLGMLRRAIEQDWAEPPACIADRKRRQFADNERQRDRETELRDDEIAEAKRERKRQRRQALPAWRSLTENKRNMVEQLAYDGLQSDFDRKRFRSTEDYRLNLSLDEFRRLKSDSRLATHSS